MRFILARSCSPFRRLARRRATHRASSARRAAPQRPWRAGVAIAIVENGKIELAQGYGVRESAKPSRSMPTRSSRPDRPARPSPPPRSRSWSTRASSSWDDKVIDHLPDFRMYDPWVTREMTVRDLLVHRSGLGLWRRRPVVRPGNRAAAPRPCGAAPHQAGDQLPQHLRLRQHPLHRRRRADRGGERPGAGNSSSATACLLAARHEQSDRRRDRLPANRTAHFHGRLDGPIVGIGRQQPYVRRRDAWRERRAGGRPRAAPMT